MCVVLYDGWQFLLNVLWGLFCVRVQVVHVLILTF